jgi:hypothetical protein
LYFAESKNIKHKKQYPSSLFGMAAIPVNIPITAQYIEWLLMGEGRFYLQLLSE